jgi:hypothetical protein
VISCSYSADPYSHELKSNCRIWIQLMHYGLATQQYLDLYPLLVRQLLYFVDKVDITVEDRQFDLDVGCSIFTLLTSVLGTVDEKLIGKQEYRITWLDNVSCMLS